MNTTTFLKTHCPACNGPIEYPLEASGERIACPHCGGPVALGTAAPARQESAERLPAATKPPRALLLIEPKTRPIHVKEPAIVTTLTIIGVLQLIAAPLFAILSNNGGVTGFAIMITAGITTLAFAKLIESTHETAQRLARMEVYFQTVVNERL